MGVRVANTHDTATRTRKEFGAINSTRIIPLDIGGDIEYINVRHGGPIVISGGTASGTSKGENPGGLLTQFRITAPSRGEYPGGELKRVFPRSVIRRRLINWGTIETDTALNGAAGTVTPDQNYELWFSQPKAPRPFDFALRSDAYKGLALHISVGDGKTSQFTGNDRTWDFSGSFFDISDYRETITGDDLKVRKHVIYEQDDILPITGANGRFPYDKVPVDFNIMDLLLMTTSTNDALVDTILNKVMLKYGQQFYEKFPLEIKHDMKRYRPDAAQSLLGMYLLAFNKDYLSYGAIPVREAGDMAGEFDVSNPGGANADNIIASAKMVLWPEDYSRVLTTDRKL